MWWLWWLWWYPLSNQAVAVVVAVAVDLWMVAVVHEYVAVRCG